MANLVSLAEARQARQSFMLSPITCEDELRLVETVVALWPIVEAAAGALCMLSDGYGGDPGYRCGECFSCQARELVAATLLKEKP